MASAAFKKFVPLVDRVLVQRVAAESKSKGGVLIPEKSQSKVQVANVMAVGPGMRTEDGKVHAPTVNVGDKVLLPEFGGTKISLEEEDFMLFRDSDILGKFVQS